jgi:hypothetical protein
LSPSSRCFSSSACRTVRRALVGGFAVVLLGLALFVKGLDAAIFPAGETMAFDFARRGSFLWLMLLPSASASPRSPPSRR